MEDQSLPADRDLRSLRVSDAEREHVTGLLQKAVGRGLITLDEFTERTDTALAAQTRGQLNSVLADLPFVQHSEQSVNTEALVLRTRTGHVAQRGHWTVPREITAECGMGSVSIDLTEATCPHREVTLRATCGAGNILVVVPRGWSVVMLEATATMGGVVNKATDPPVPGMPVLRVYATAGMGHVRIRYPRGRK